MNRRDFLGLAATTAAASATGCARVYTVKPPPQLPPAPQYRGANSLKAHAATKGFLYGCAVNTNALQNDEAYAKLVAEQSNILVAENAMKWGPLRPTSDTYHFTDADALVAFAEQHHIKVRGHNLCWHHQIPKWFDTEATSANARALLTSHIQTVAGRYAGRMHSWDVVNEAILISDGRPDGLRNSPWLKLIGEDYIELAFRTARDADPNALLTYNDYGIEGEDDESARKRAAVLTLLRRLKARHVPLDALGVQSHIEAGAPGVASPKITYGNGLRDFLTAVRELGLQIFATELDVNDRAWPADADARDQGVARTYGSYLNLILAEPAMRVVLTWGITNRYTWLNSESARKDHLPERCLPFDTDYMPLPSFFAMRNSFDERKPLPTASTL
jgi:endo-1,4-beta-xylanase